MSLSIIKLGPKKVTKNGKTGYLSMMTSMATVAGPKEIKKLHKFLGKWLQAQGIDI